MLSSCYYKYINTLVISKKDNLSYTQVYISLINPNSIKSMNNLVNKSKILIKQSYILFVWVAYISTLNPKTFVLPKVMYKFTLNKSPMAQKTFSQEQYKLEYYKIIVPFTVKYSRMKKINSVSGSKNFIIKLRNIAFDKMIGTNLLIQKKTKVKYFFFEKKYYNTH